jgi:hypothetical protein
VAKKKKKKHATAKLHALNFRRQETRVRGTVALV